MFSSEQETATGELRFKCIYVDVNLHIGVKGMVSLHDLSNLKFCFLTVFLDSHVKCVGARVCICFVLDYIPWTQNSA